MVMYILNYPDSCMITANGLKYLTKCSWPHLTILDIGKSYLNEDKII